MHFLVRFIINAFALYLIVNYVPGFTNAQGVQHFGIWTVVILAVVFGIINALIGPILKLISAPITWLTHGIFSIVINWILFGLAVWLMPGVKGGWLPTLEGAIILMIVSTILQQIWKSGSEKAPA